MSGGLVAYVTSSFAQHGLTATTSVMANLIGGLSKIPLAKILDIWGRPQGFVLMLACLVIGLIMMAACQNVETYAAAQVFYWVGYVLCYANHMNSCWAVHNANIVSTASMASATPSPSSLLTHLTSRTEG